MTKLDWLLRECVREAFIDGVGSPSFYHAVYEVWHHVNREAPVSGNAPETTELHLEIKQYALGFYPCLGPAQVHERWLREPVWPSAHDLNRKIEAQKPSFHVAKQ